MPAPPTNAEPSELTTPEIELPVMFEFDMLTRHGKKTNPAPAKMDPVDDDLTLLFINEDASMYSCAICARPEEAITDVSDEAPEFWKG